MDDFFDQFETVEPEGQAVNTNLMPDQFAQSQTLPPTDNYFDQFESADDIPVETVEQPQTPVTSTGQGLLTGTQKGVSFGLSDEIAGLMGAGIEGIAESPAEGESKIEQLNRLYEEYRNRERKRIQKVEKEAPIASTVGDIVGGLLIPGGIFKSLGGGVKGAAKIGAASGALEAVGRTEENLASAEGIQDVALGAGLGGALGGVAGKVASKYAQPKLAEKATEAAQEANIETLRSIGARKTDFLNEFQAKTSKRSGAEKAKGTGQVLLDEDLIRYKQEPVKFNAELNERLDSVFEDRIVPITKQLDKKLSKANPEIVHQETLDLSARLLSHVQELSELNKFNPGKNTSLVDNAVESAEEIVSKLANSQNPNKMTEALEAKRKISKLLHNSDWTKSEVSGAKDYLKNMMLELKTYSENLATAVDPKLSLELRKQNNVYSGLTNAKAIAIQDLAKDSAASGIAKGDYLTMALGGTFGGMTGGVTGGTIGSVAALAAKKKFEKEMGKSLPELYSTYRALKSDKAAKSLADRASNYGGMDKLISEGSDTLAQKAVTTAAAATDSTDAQTPYKRDRAATEYIKTASPEVISSEVNRIREQYGESGEKLATMLEKVSQRDATGRNALMFSILQNPAHRKMLGLMDDQDEPDL
jgi:hypothetical protein